MAGGGGEVDCEVVREMWVSIDMNMRGRQRNAMIEMQRNGNETAKL